MPYEGTAWSLSPRHPFVICKSIARCGRYNADLPALPREPGSLPAISATVEKNAPGGLTIPPPASPLAAMVETVGESRAGTLHKLQPHSWSLFRTLDTHSGHGVWALWKVGKENRRQRRSDSDPLLPSDWRKHYAGAKTLMPSDWELAFLLVLRSIFWLFILLLLVALSLFFPRFLCLSISL